MDDLTEVLRHAAKLMRERAEAQPRAAWLVIPPDRHRGAVVRDHLAKIVTADVPEWVVARTLTDAAAHIASWHPLVAAEVAAVLDACADEMDADLRDGLMVGAAVLRLARAYLGEPDDIA